MTQRQRDLSLIERLPQQAAREAIADAGVAPGDFDTTIYANVVQAFVAGEMSIPGEYALRPLGIAGVRTFRVEAACASATMERPSGVSSEREASCAASASSCSVTPETGMNSVA